MDQSQAQNTVQNIEVKALQEDNNPPDSSLIASWVIDGILLSTIKELSMPGSPSNSSEEEKSDCVAAILESRVRSNKSEGAEGDGGSTNRIETSIIRNSPLRSSSGNSEHIKGDLISIMIFFILLSYLSFINLF